MDRTATKASVADKEAPEANKAASEATKAASVAAKAAMVAAKAASVATKAASEANLIAVASSQKIWAETVVSAVAAMAATALTWIASVATMTMRVRTRMTTMTSSKTVCTMRISMATTTMTTTVPDSIWAATVETLPADQWTAWEDSVTTIMAITNQISRWIMLSMKTSNLATVAMVTHQGKAPTLTASLATVAASHGVVESIALPISETGENQEKINSLPLDTDDSKKLSFVQYYYFKPFSVNIYSTSVMLFSIFNNYSIIQL